LLAGIVCAESVRRTFMAPCSDQAALDRRIARMILFAEENKPRWCAPT
jgi:hypothetical protein